MRYQIPIAADPETDWDSRYSIIQRLLVLWTQTPCRLGVILVESGRFWVCGTPGDPLGSINPHANKNYYRISELEKLCTELENNPDLMWLDAENGPRFTRKPAQSESNYSRISRKLA